jgi:hypothetical protein
MAVFVECPKRPTRTMYDEMSTAHGHDCETECTYRPVDPGPNASRRDRAQYEKGMAAHMDLMCRQKALVIEPRKEPHFLCGDKVEQEPFCACGHTAEMLCDYPMGCGKTCDLPVCWCCSRHIAEDHDLCLIHFAEFVGKARAEKINPWPPPKR